MLSRTEGSVLEVEDTLSAALTAKVTLHTSGHCLFPGQGAMVHMVEALCPVACGHSPCLATLFLGPRGLS